MTPREGAALLQRCLPLGVASRSVMLSAPGGNWIVLRTVCLSVEEPAVSSFSFCDQAKLQCSLYRGEEFALEAPSYGAGAVVVHCGNYDQLYQGVVQYQGPVQCGEPGVNAVRTCYQHVGYPPASERLVLALV